MAKKPIPDAPADKTTTYSTRLNEKQRALLEEAAEALGVSASKFIRDAALLAAADAVNTQGQNEAAIDTAMHTLAEKIKHPSVVIRERSLVIGQTREHEVQASPGDIALRTHNSDETDEYEFYAESINIPTLTKGEIRTLRDIAESCPIAFSAAFRKAVDGTSRTPIPFTPRANPKQILDG